MANEDNEPHATSFTPAVQRYRHDGWTAERQIAFIEKLADCGSITAACAHVGMSRESVRKLRRRLYGRAFRDAMDAALDCSYCDIEDCAAERSRNGVPRPIFYKGEQVGEWRHYDERMTIFLLHSRRRHRFGFGRPGQPIEHEIPFDPEAELEGQLDAIEFSPPPPPDEDDADEAAQ